MKPKAFLSASRASHPAIINLCDENTAETIKHAQQAKNYIKYSVISSSSVIFIWKLEHFFCSSCHPRQRRFLRWKIQPEGKLSVSRERRWNFRQGFSVNFFLASQFLFCVLVSSSTFNINSFSALFSSLPSLFVERRSFLNRNIIRFLLRKFSLCGRLGSEAREKDNENWMRFKSRGGKVFRFPEVICVLHW